MLLATLIGATFKSHQPIIMSNWKNEQMKSKYLLCPGIQVLISEFRHVNVSSRIEEKEMFELTNESVWC